MKELTAKLNPGIFPVGVFVNCTGGTVAEQLLNDGTISLAQLHGQEDEDYIRQLKIMTDQLLIKAFSVKTEEDVNALKSSEADYILLDQGAAEPERPLTGL